MTRSARAVGAVLAFTVLGTLVPALAQAPRPDAVLLQRLAALSAEVPSYTASLHADVTLRSFPFLSHSLDGTYYHKEPSKNKIVFTGEMPFIAKQFSKIYPQVESPSRWNDVYVVSTEGDDAGITTFRLVPRKHGRVDHIDAKVDDKTAELVSMRWNYEDGGYASLDQTYGPVSGHLMVTAQSGHVDVPHYSADLRSKFSDFKLNAAIPDSVFTQS